MICEKNLGSFPYVLVDILLFVDKITHIIMIMKML
jgi:hypothetical protein